MQIFHCVIGETGFALIATRVLFEYTFRYAVILVAGATVGSPCRTCHSAHKGITSFTRLPVGGSPGSRPHVGVGIAVGVLARLAA